MFIEIILFLLFILSFTSIFVCYHFHNRGFFIKESVDASGILAVVFLIAWLTKAVFFSTPPIPNFEVSHFTESKYTKQFPFLLTIVNDLEMEKSKTPINFFTTNLHTHSKISLNFTEDAIGYAFLINENTFIPITLQYPHDFQIDINIPKSGKLLLVLRTNDLNPNVTINK